MPIKENKALNTNFTLFLLGRMVSDTGTSIQMMIMPLYIIDAGGTAATIGLFSFLSLLPALFVYPFAGVLGDRLNRKKIMVITDFISAGVILSLGLISYMNLMRISLLLIVQVIISLLNGLFEPATRGMLPQLVAKDELTRGNSTVASTRSASVMLGPVIGAALYANFGITIVFFVNGISFLLSGITEMLIKYKHSKREVAGGIRGILDDLSEGIRFILSNKIISRLCLFFLVVYLVVQPFFSVILPLFFKTSLDYSDVQYGYLQMIIVFGALLGSLTIGILYGKDAKVRSPLMGGAGLLILTMLMYALLMLPRTLATLGNNTTQYFASLAVVLCLFSTANMFIAIPVQAYIQKETPNQYMSRVFSLVSMISRGGIPLGALVYGFVLEKVSMHWVVLVATLMMLLLSIGFLASLNNEKIKEK
ncbi:MFS transporter [Alkaliphilus peptidifermentans]|uniref:Predicted arabinose efflux permease, MFS family n=1 Tax=Alkaliphilus peptidifermentans DSM 18978 TaxID=1120976 RepID=A0A1G5G2G1_9FIRM|nr:MFS transporter [Alkaliphilus peptidifermentans]SCY45591.1 Predicted arabinose efflux permease, MFS family [Alkaliphilus peptidifermentans DSM 18978]